MEAREVLARAECAAVATRAETVCDYLSHGARHEMKSVEQRIRRIGDC
jgi:hypothetical protein